MLICLWLNLVFEILRILNNIFRYISLNKHFSFITPQAAGQQAETTELFYPDIPPLLLSHSLLNSCHTYSSVSCSFNLASIQYAMYTSLINLLTCTCSNHRNIAFSILATTISHHFSVNLVLLTLLIHLILQMQIRVKQSQMRKYY